MLAKRCIRRAGSEASFEEMSSMGPKKYRSETASATSHPSVPLQYTQASPFVSYFGRPARPSICRTSMTGSGRLIPSSQRFRSLTRTRRAGRLTPAARVGVAVNATNRPGFERRLGVFSLSIGQSSVMKTNAGSEAVGQLLGKVGLAASRQGLGEGVEFFHAFRVLL